MAMEASSMEIKVKLFATLRDYLPKNSDGKSCQLEIDEKTTIKQILDQFKIPEEIPKIILVNGLRGSIDQTLKEGDVLSIFPPVAGG